MAGQNGILNRMTSPPKMQGYRPNVFGAGMMNAWLDGKPLFTIAQAEQMLYDPMVAFCLAMIEGPLHQVKFKFKAETTEAQQFLEGQWKKIWQSSLSKFCQALAYGRSVGETEYGEADGYVQFTAFHDANPFDVRPLVWDSGPKKGSVGGITVQNNFSSAIENVKETKVAILAPHAFWFAGEAKFGSLIGRPRLVGMYAPWLEKNSRNGALDSRKLWYRKNAFRGGKAWYPIGQTNIGTDAAPNMRDNQDLIREAIEKAENGGVMALPNVEHATILGEMAWKIEDPATITDVAGLRDYPKDLDDEILIGAGIPPELIHSSGGGLGEAGRNLPATMFFASEDKLCRLLITAIDQQIMKPIMTVNFGEIKYSIEHISMVDLLDDPQDTETEEGVTEEAPAAVAGGEQNAVEMSQDLIARVRALAAVDYPDLRPVDLDQGSQSTTAEPPATSTPEPKPSLGKRIGAAAGAALSKIPGGSFARKVGGAIHQRMIKRYGVANTAKAIAAGHALGWGSAAAFGAAGLPGAWIPSPISAPILAELHHQFGKKKAVSMSIEEDAHPDLSQEEIDKLARDLHDEIHGEWKKHLASTYSGEEIDHIGRLAHDVVKAMHKDYKEESED